MTPSTDDSLADRILAQSPDAIATFDAACRVTFLNVAMERLCGLFGPEAVGRHLSEVLLFLAESGDEALFRRVLAGESVASNGCPFFGGKGRLRGLLDCTFGPLRDQAGRVVGGLAVFRDVTAQRQLDERLRESETRFRTMADAAPVLLWMADPDGLCTFFNQRWMDFTGRTQQEEWGVGWAERVHFEDFQHCMDTFNQAFNRREVFEMEYRLQRKDGEFRWILDRGVPRFTPEGSFAGYIGSCIDITERRHLEGELRKAVKVRDEFLSVASHELKTPLTSLQLQVDSLRRVAARATDGELRVERVERAATAISLQSRRLTELIDVLLDVSRINSGLLALDPSELDLLGLVHAAVARWTPAMRSRDAHETPVLGGIELVVVGEQAPLHGCWDRLRLEQVLNNLLSNAVKYGGNEPIVVRVEGGPDWVSIEVEDHGIGVSPEDQARIFGRFERAVSNNHYGGLGLGLWITREIVSGMGGRIELESEVGQGSVFRLWLPRHVLPASQPSTASDPAA